MNLKKPIDKRNGIFILLLALSNLMSWQLGSLTQTVDQQTESFYRPDYDTVKLQAKSFVPFERLRPVHIKRNQKVIGYGLLLNEEVETGFFTLYCPKKFLNLLTRSDDLELVPFLEGIKVSNRIASKGENYEIIIR